MKKRLWISLVVFVAIAGLAIVAGAKEKKPKAGPITGTWDCVSHGGSQGDMPFTLYLEQIKMEVTGSVSSPIGGTQISSGSFNKKLLEIHIDTPQGNYVIKGTLKKGQLSGDWSSDNEKGTWEGKRQAASATGT